MANNGANDPVTIPRVRGPRTFDPLVAAKIVASLEAGLYRAAAFRAAGVPPKTAIRWLEAGSRGADPLLADFFGRASEAEAKAMDRYLATIQQAAFGGDWKAAAWILERRWPKLWGTGEQRAIVDPRSRAAAERREGKQLGQVLGMRAA